MAGSLTVPPFYCTDPYPRDEPGRQRPGPGTGPKPEPGQIDQSGLTLYFSKLFQ